MWSIKGEVFLSTYFETFVLLVTYGNNKSGIDRSMGLFFRVRLLESTSLYKELLFSCLTNIQLK